MNCDSILESHHPQVPAAQFRNRRPKAVSVVLLALRPNRVLKHANTPRLLEVGALPLHFLLKIVGELVLTHPQALGNRLRSRFCRLTRGSAVGGADRLQLLVSREAELNQHVHERNQDRRSDQVYGKARTISASDSAGALQERFRGRH